MFAFGKRNRKNNKSIKSTSPHIAIVILNYNGKKHLQDFLPSVIQHSEGLAEIIVADNGSTDDSCDFLKSTFPKVRLLEMPENYGFAEGYNQALKQVEADYYVILNSDVEVTAGWIEPIIEMMESNKKIAAVQPKIRAFHQKDHFEYAGAAGGMMDKWGYMYSRGRIFDTLEKDNGQYDEVIPITWASGAAMFIRAELYHNFGGFDGDYFAHMEEIDLCWRMRRAGYRIMAQPKSVVFHVGGGTLDYNNPRKTFLNFRNIYTTLVKNLPFGTLFWLIPLRLVLDAAAAFLFLTKGQFQQIWSIARAHWTFFFSIFKILKKKKQTDSIVEKYRVDKINQESVATESVVIGYYLRGKRTANEYLVNR